MKIKTNTPLVKKAREGVMEFLLLNHPLDCPICDQGGECDLQDQAMVFGSDRGRFTDMKRSVVDKHLGPLIKTVMTRCIHCTRCVRYATEIAGVEDLGVLGRGNAEEIGTYVDRLSTSEVSGNVIDLCPVGALTSKPYAFTARNWELSNKESIDVSDALGANIRVDHRGPEVMRIVPRLNEDVNEEWLTDKGRFMYDGLKRQRLAQPYVRGPDGLLRQSDWREALQEAANALKAVSGEEIAAVAGKLADVESITALKDLMARLNSQRLYIEGAEGQENADIRPSYLLNTGIAALEDADAVLLVGTDLRSEAPLLNVRLRKAFRAGTLRDIAAVGPEDMDLTYPHEHLGDKAQDLSKLTGGKDGFAAKLAKAERPAIIIGAGVLRRADKEAILGVVDRIVKQAGVIKEGWNGLNVLQLSAGTTGALDLGFVPGPAAKKDAPPAKVVYLLGADEGLSKFVGEDSFVIYQGHHGDQGASRANVVLPGAAYTEKEATYVNTEGRPQRTVAAVPVPGNAREDWKIIRALSEIAGVQLPYDTTDAVRRRAYEIAPQLERTEEVEVSEVSVGARTAPSKASAGPLLKEPFGRAVPNFYMTDPISRASQTMARCTSMFKSQKEVDAQEHWLLHADWGKQKAAKQPAL
jgi:NADH dehydrogenase (ubiquinone) Fe-S protein 1